MKKELKIFRKKSKKAQFYLIAAVIIIVIIVALTSTTNQVITKENRARTQVTIESLNYEALKTIDNLNYQGGNTQKKINKALEDLTDLFSEYLSQSVNEEFGLYVFYGVTSSNTISGNAYVQTSSGTVSVDNMQVINGQIVTQTATYGETREGADGNNYMDITIEGVTYTARLLDQQNFIVILTTSDGFNNYVETNFEKN